MSGIVIPMFIGCIGVIALTIFQEVRSQKKSKKKKKETRPVSQANWAVISKNGEPGSFPTAQAALAALSPDKKQEKDMLKIISPDLKIITVDPKNIKSLMVSRGSSVSEDWRLLVNYKNGDWDEAFYKTLKAAQMVKDVIDWEMKDNG